MDAERTAAAPPAALRVLLFASLSLSVLTAGYAFHYTRDWYEVRRGTTLVEQRLSLRGVAYFKRDFMVLVRRLQRTIPPGSKVLVEPGSGGYIGSTGRWYLFLNHYAYPLRIYVRQPALASGTLVDYPSWVEHHLLTLDVTDRRRENLQQLLEQDEIRKREEDAIRERGIEWLLRYPLSEKMETDRVELYKLHEGKWRRFPLASADEQRPRGRTGGRTGAEELSE